MTLESTKQIDAIEIFLPEDRYDVGVVFNTLGTDLIAKDMVEQFISAVLPTDVEPERNVLKAIKESLEEHESAFKAGSHYEISHGRLNRITEIHNNITRGDSLISEDLYNAAAQVFNVGMYTPILPYDETQPVVSSNLIKNHVVRLEFLMERYNVTHYTLLKSLRDQLDHSFVLYGQELTNFLEQIIPLISSPKFDQFSCNEVIYVVNPKYLSEPHEIDVKYKTSFSAGKEDLVDLLGEVDYELKRFNENPNKINLDEDSVERLNLFFSRLQKEIFVIRAKTHILANRKFEAMVLGFIKMWK